MLVQLHPGAHLTCDYRNWHGDDRRRHIMVRNIYWGTTDFYREPQWLVACVDLEKQESRIFALNRILNPEVA